MRIEQCWFCGGPVYPGHGTIFVRNDCRIFRFCRSKCNKLFKRKKNPRKLRWTQTYRKLRGKQLTKDSIFAFEMKRNRPLKYSRPRLQTALRAIKRVQQIKEAREKLFYNNRMKIRKITDVREGLKDLNENIALIEPDVVRVKKLREREMEVEAKKKDAVIDQISLENLQTEKEKVVVKAKDTLVQKKKKKNQ
eukprot:TRINITY_DN901_c0_g1_i1.p1 TRINITY_DN901_c0_g1~~TRINITY_DN901_c0_g1_i1.p1  ORF type:complete len:193 (-),score=37.63 TRINITY_DN901_c0_g1_i1:48-626(-)